MRGNNYGIYQKEGKKNIFLGFRGDRSESIKYVYDMFITLQNSTFNYKGLKYSFQSINDINKVEDYHELKVIANSNNGGTLPDCETIIYFYLKEVESLKFIKPTKDNPLLYPAAIVFCGGDTSLDNRVAKEFNGIIKKKWENHIEHYKKKVEIKPVNVYKKKFSEIPVI